MNLLSEKTSRDLAETQVEKLKSLVNDIIFEDEDTFAEKVSTVKESYFKKEAEVSDETIMESDDADTVEVSGNMERYVCYSQNFTQIRINEMESYDRLIEKWSPVLNEESAVIGDHYRKP